MGGRHIIGSWRRISSRGRMIDRVRCLEGFNMLLLFTDQQLQLFDLGAQV